MDYIESLWNTLMDLSMNFFKFRVYTRVYSGAIMLVVLPVILIGLLIVIIRIKRKHRKKKKSM